MLRGTVTMVGNNIMWILRYQDQGIPSSLTTEKFWVFEVVDMLIILVWSLHNTHVLKCGVVPHEHVPLCLWVKKLRNHLNKVGTYGCFALIHSDDGNGTAGTV